MASGKDSEGWMEVVRIISKLDLGSRSRVLEVLIDSDFWIGSYPWACSLSEVCSLCLRCHF